MTTLMKTASLATLILLFSGCNNLNNNLNTPAIKPKVDQTLEMINKDSIKTISDITSIAFEWQKVEDPRVVGYNFYRSDVLKDGRTLKLVKSLRNRYATHYVDSGLEPNTKYIYQISSKTKDGIESNTTEAYLVQTLPRLEAVSFVQAISDLPNRIKILWRPHEDKTVEYYKIEKFNLAMNKWEHLAKVDGRLQVEYIDDDLDNEEEGKYRITAYNFKDIASKPTTAVLGKTKALPLSPTDVKASNNLAKKIELSWSPSPTEDVIKYAIFRSPFQSIGFSQEYEVKADTLNLVDTVNDDDKKYYYKVYAVDKDGLYSNMKVDSTEGKTLGKPAKPVITLAQIQGNKAILNWKAGDNRAVSYNVYKRIRLNFFEYKTVKYTDIRALRFEDTDIISGIEYKYSIQANDENSLISDKTDEALLTIPKTPTLK